MAASEGVSAGPLLWRRWCRRGPLVPGRAGGPTRHLTCQAGLKTRSSSRAETSASVYQLAGMVCACMEGAVLRNVARKCLPPPEPPRPASQAVPKLSQREQMCYYQAWTDI